MNADHALCRRFLQGGRVPLDMEGNPLAQALAGSILELDSAGRALLVFVPPQQFVQAAHVLQGGIIAAMLDFAMVFAAHASLEGNPAFSTATLNVNLLRPAVPARYLARGRIVRKGRKLLFADAELLPSDGGRPLATASSVIALVPGEREIR